MNIRLEKALSYEQRIALFFYRTFFKSNYFDDYKKNNGQDINIAHVNMQKMIYILNVKGIGIGNYGFSWNIRGPYSIELMEFIKDIDGLNVESANDDNWESLGFIELKNVVEDLIDKLEIHKKNNYDWIELLSSIIYLSQDVYPGLNRDEIFKELFDRKENFKLQNEMCREAWNILSNEGMLTCKS